MICASYTYNGIWHNICGGKMVEKSNSEKVYPAKENSDDIYEEEDVEEQVENDEISIEEAGFMEGYDNPNLIVCKKCKKKLKDETGIDLEKCHEEKDDNDNTIWVCDCCEE